METINPPATMGPATAVWLTATMGPAVVLGGPAAVWLVSPLAGWLTGGNSLAGWWLVGGRLVAGWLAVCWSTCAACSPTCRMIGGQKPWAIDMDNKR